MSTNQNTLGIIPTNQPYSNSPFNYAGSEVINGTINSNVVDWILIEIRDSTRTSVLESQAALLMKDGSVFSANTQTSGVDLSIVGAGNYFVIVRHRTHLAISSSTALTMTPGTTTSIDYSTNTNVLGSNQTLISTSPTTIYGMKSGNTHGDSSIDATDRTLARSSGESYGIYTNRDLNLDGIVNATDRNMARIASDSSDGI